jgi:hypothetical protein
MARSRTANTVGKKRAKAPVPEENPGWLAQLPEQAPRPPIHQIQSQLLPFLEQGWPDFERLCRRLALRGGEVEAVWSYGTAGQAQYGIDLLVRLADGKYEVWQTKRFRRIRAADVAAAVNLFLNHKWAAKAKKFVLAVATDLRERTVVEALESARTGLLAQGIEFGAWGATELTEQLASEPEIVDDFFGRPWVRAVCPPEALERLKDRISPVDLGTLRTRLRDCYRSWIMTVDPGLPIAGLDRLGRTQPSVSILERYVQPDIITRIASPSESRDELRDSSQNAAAADDGRDYPNERPRHGARRNVPVVHEQRSALGQFLLFENQAVIVGDPGAGKSTLLRFLALDLLADTPVLTVARERYAKYLPIWVPFALWSRMSEGKAAPPPLAEVVAEFFRALSEPDLADDVRRALSSEKVILLIDGLDEATNQAAAQTVAAVLTSFIGSRKLPALVTSRPHGVRALSGLVASWTHAELAPLSVEQRTSLARLWFKLLLELESAAFPGAHASGVQAERLAAAFVAALQRNPGLTRLSQTPLFFLALINLHRRGQQLPRSRFAAIRSIVEELVELQPQRRARGALSTTSATINPRVRDRLLEDFAFALQANEVQGAVTDAATEEAAIIRATERVMERQGVSRDSAEASARDVFEFAEERAGVLVKKASDNIGFLHLSIQEFLAGRHLLQRPVSARAEFIRQHAGSPRWHEPILYLLSLTDSEPDVGVLITAIEQATGDSIEGKLARESLLADAAFSDLAHDLPVVRRVVERLFSEAEHTAWGARQYSLLSGAVAGLSSETVGELCRNKISEWVPDRHGWSRADALAAIPQWSKNLQESAIEVLLRSLHASEERTWRTAAWVIAEIAGRSEAIKAKLLAVLKAAPSLDVVTASLLSLSRGWPEDADVAAIAASLRRASDPGVSLQAIRLRATRKETDDADFDRFFKLSHQPRGMLGNRVAPDLTEHFAQTHRTEFVRRLEALISGLREDNPHDLFAPLASLVYCDPTHPLISEKLRAILQNEWTWHTIFPRNAFPVERVQWTADFVQLIERALDADKHAREHELYWIARVMPADSFKKRFLGWLKARDNFKFWSSDALVEIWGSSDPEVRETLLPFLDGDPQDIALVAEALVVVADNKEECLAAFKRSLRAKPHRTDFLYRALRRMDADTKDDDLYDAWLTAKDGLSAPAYADPWRGHMIRLFPDRSLVRQMGLAEVALRDGDLGAVASAYGSDPEIVAKILQGLCPLDDAARSALVAELEESAPFNMTCEVLLHDARHDTRVDVSSEATLGWVVSRITHDELDGASLDEFEAQLTAVGHDYEGRRAAAVAVLAIAGKLERFANKEDHAHKPLCVPIRGDHFRGRGRYLPRLLPIWGYVAETLGGDDQAFVRLGISQESDFASLEPGYPATRRILARLAEKGPRNENEHEALLAATIRFEGYGAPTREMIANLLTKMGGGNAAQRASEVFADHFSDDLELRESIVKTVTERPYHDNAVSALAELILRKPDTEIETLLRKIAPGQRHAATHFKLVAALAEPRAVLDELARAAEKGQVEPYHWGFDLWVNAMTRRVANDDALRTVMLGGLNPDSSPSMAVSLAALLIRAVPNDAAVRSYAEAEVSRLRALSYPIIGFDLTRVAHRPLERVLFNVWDRSSWVTV